MTLVRECTIQKNRSMITRFDMNDITTVNGDMKRTNTIVAPLILCCVLCMFLIFFIGKGACSKARRSIPVGVKIQNRTAHDVGIYLLNFTDEQFGPLREINAGQTVMIQSLSFHSLQAVQDALVSIAVVCKERQYVTVESINWVELRYDAAAPFPYYVYNIDN